MVYIITCWSLLLFFMSMACLFDLESMLDITFLIYVGYKNFILLDLGRMKVHIYYFWVCALIFWMALGTSMLS